MLNRKNSVTLSLVVCYVICAVLTIGLFLGPWAVKMWFCVYRGWNGQSVPMEQMLTLFKACFYPCAVIAYVTLYSLIRLLLNIKRDEIFIKENVQYLRRISWCCFVVALITGVGGLQYLPFLFVTIAAAFIGLMLRVVKNVVDSAIKIKTENELTI